MNSAIEFAGITYRRLVLAVSGAAASGAKCRPWPIVAGGVGTTLHVGGDGGAARGTISSRVSRFPPMVVLVAIARPVLRTARLVLAYAKMVDLGRVGCVDDPYWSCCIMWSSETV